MSVNYLTILISPERQEVDIMLNKLMNSIVTVAGVKVVNTTPHAINMVTPDLAVQVTVPASGVLINAKPIAVPVDSGIVGVQFQRTSFDADADTMDVLKAFKTANPDVVVIGSLIAAQAYPGLVVAMVAHPDFARVAPADKKMLIDTYTVY